jgi:DnaJ-class molecular chaperone
LERFHFVGRQRVENALGALLPAPTPCDECKGTGRAFDNIDGMSAILAATPCPACFGTGTYDLAAVILLAAWCPRNGGIACVGHHRRLDSAATPSLTVPRAALPAHVEEFAADYGLELELERKFP